MNPLALIKRLQSRSDRIKGFLLFLLLLLFLNFSLMGNRKITPVKAEKAGDDYSIKKEELSAYQKMTLGIPLNLNSETQEGLTAIPGIGKSLASRIVKERIKRDGFKNINELRGISGIGEKTYLKIVPHVRL